VTRPDVVVVGAGFAGVAAATALAERGARVLVLETRQRSGGRAYSWIDPSGEVRDNGQHVLAAFYDQTWKLLARIGTERELAADPTFCLRFWERGRGEYELRCPNLPAPLHWIAAIATCPRFSPKARLAAAALRPKAAALLGTKEPGSAGATSPAGATGSAGATSPTVSQWLEREIRDPDLAAVLEPLALAALNERPEHGSAVLFARVLDRLLGAPARKSGLALPRRGLGDLLGGFEGYLEERGGSVRYRATVLGVRVESGRVSGVSLLGGERIEAGSVVLAVPHERVTWLLRPELAEPYRAVAAVPWSPIVSTLHVYDRPVLPARFVGLIGSPTQWAFDRGALEPGAFAVGTVRSAAFEDAARPPEEIADETAADLREAFEAARGAALLRSRVYKERRATMRATPDTEALRPPSRTHVEGLFLAGDWTDTGLPPTIESAAASGHRAADEVR
jgi:squalene-associated FAD-dependent desaturase